MKLRLVLLIIVAVSASVHAQELKTTPGSNGQPQSVTNDDEGRAFIISDELQPLSSMERKGKAIAEPEQTSIFLGGDWETSSLRARQPKLANLLANVGDQAEVGALDESGIKNFFSTTSSLERLDYASDRSISDLEIQSLLSAMLKDGSLRPNRNTIYVVFLAPGMRSRLGTMIGGKHYLAYHNFLNASGMKIHYVVVPFSTNQKTAYRVALKALVAAAVNTNGAGS